MVRPPPDLTYATIAMHIGIEAQRLFRRRKHGMDIVALESVRALQGLDLPFDVSVFVRPGEDRCLESGGRVRIVEVPGASYPTWEQIALPRAVRRAGVDLLHCTANTAPLAPGVPTIVTLHDVIFLEPSSGPGASTYQRAGNLYRRFVCPIAARGSEVVTTVSRYERRQIVSTLKPAPTRVEVIPNAVSERFTPGTPSHVLRSVAHRYGLPDRFFLFFGNTDPKKNVPRVIEAYVRASAASADLPKLVVADLDSERLVALLREMNAPEALDRFVLPGYIAHADLPAVYTLADAFLYPSLRESFGLPILEAMACGVPVLTSDAAAMPEIAGNAALLVDPTDVSSIAGGLVRVSVDFALRGWLRDVGPHRAAGFKWNTTAQQLANLYESVVQHSQTRAVSARSARFVDKAGRLVEERHARAAALGTIAA